MVTRLVAWLCALALFLISTSAAYILVPLPGSERRSTARAAASVGAGPERLTGAVDAELEEIEAPLRDATAELGCRLGSFDASFIEDALRRLEWDRPARERLEAEVADVLARALGGLTADIAVVWTPDGRRFAASRSRPEVAAPAGRLLAADLVRRASGGRSCVTARAGIELVGAGGGDEGPPEVAAVACRPLRPRPDGPHAVLVAARRVSLGFAGQPGALRRHLAAWTPGKPPRVVAGARAGAALRPSLAAELERRLESAEPAFSDEAVGHVGRWVAFRDLGGRIAAALGATALGEDGRSAAAR